MPQIEQVDIQDFGCLEHLRLRPARVNVITGPNQSGKSTLQKALCFFLGGEVSRWMEGQAEKREALPGLVRHGASRAEVTWRVGGQRVTRSIPHALALDGGGKVTLEEGQARLDDLLGAPGRMAALALTPRLLALDEKEQTAQRFDLVGLDITDDLVRRELARRAERADLPLVEEAERVLRGPVDRNLERLHRAFYDARTGVNREIKSLQEQRIAERDRALPQVEAPAPEALAAARRDLEALVAAQAAERSHGQELARLRQEVEQAARRLRDLEASAGGEAPDATWMARFEKSRKVLRELQEEEQILEAAAGDRLTAKRLHADASARIEALKVLRASTCPECGQAVQDDSQARRNEERLRELQAGLAKLEQELAKPDPRPAFEAIRGRIANGEAWIAEHRAGYEAGLAAAKARGQVDEARRYLEAREAALREAEGRAPAGVDPERLEALRGQVADLEARGRQAQQVRDQEAWSRDLDARLAAAQERKRCLEHLVDFAGDGDQGLRRTVLRAKLQPLEGRLNAILGRWGLSVTHDPKTTEILVRNAPGVDPLPFQRLSDSTRLLVSLAHQVHVAAVTGLRMVAIDRIESLDPERQALLFQAALDLRDEVDSWWLYGVRAEVPDHPDVQHVVLAGARALAIPA